MAKAEDIARYLLLLACEEQEAEPITHLRLQKLLYYAQGWALAMTDRPLFDEVIEGWVFGPVVPSVHRKFAAFGQAGIPATEACHSPLLTTDQLTLVESVWENYKSFSAIGLMKRTHSELPWINSRKGLGPRERGDAPIDPEDMKQFFRAEYAKHALPGLELETMEKAKRDFANGRGVSLADVRQRLKCL